MKKFTYALLLMLTLASCFSGDLKDKMSDTMKKMQTSLADQTFRRMLGEIEMHKLRNGSYPASLSELRFLNSLDSANLKSVEYHLLDSGYELNLHMKIPMLNGKQVDATPGYPDDFWKGLGCKQSNLRGD